MIPWLLLLSYFAVVYACLWKLFVKAGRKAWEGFVPFYNLYVWNQIIGKPWYWLILLLVPGINLLMFIIMNVNLSIVFGEREFKQHLKAAFLPWLVIPQLAYQEKYTYVGPIAHEKRHRGLLGQWGDAILFAVIVATVFRTFTFEAFTIPTESMEKSLLVGDYLFVSKLSYGARMPMTPVTFPFTHHTLPLTTSTPSFTNWFSQPYRRLPGFGSPQIGDAVVFNFPEGDTVVANYQKMSYYQLARSFNRKDIANGYFIVKDEMGRNRRVATGGLLIRPLDKKENYIKRCVAVAGDSLQVKDGLVYVNGVPQPLRATGQYAYGFSITGVFNKKVLKETMDITTTDVNEQGDTAEMPLTAANAEKLKSFGNVSRMVRQNKEAGVYGAKDAWPIFPNDPRYNWSEDNFGPLWIPKAGATLQLTLENLPLYRRAIEVYEHNTLEVKGGAIMINGTVATSYTFKQDYYWMMGDNRHRSQDSRYWGFVPMDHVVGKAVLVWLTVDKENGGFPMGIRWKRLFTLVK
ncbi:MAG: signal peptidase I [Flavobacteriales bacterium]|nr:signal peptidase I [Flavobacteriales bacterium]